MTGVPHIVRAQRPGKPLRWYIYAWRGGPRVRVAEQPRRPTLTPADHAAIAEAHSQATTLPDHLVEGAVARFRKSAYWRGLAPGTQKTWGRALDAIETKWQGVPLRVLSDPRMKVKLVAWRDNLAQTNARGADIAVTVAGKFFEWAMLEGLAMANPAAGIPAVYRATDRAPVIWLADDIAAIEAVADQPLKDALRLAALTGLRRQDLVTLRWDEVTDLAIVRTAAKRSRRKRYRVTLPRLPELDALLEDLKARPRGAGVETVLVNRWGQSWAPSGDGLATSFSDARARANGKTGIWHVERDPVTGEETRLAKRLHDFRGTYATKLLTHPSARLTDKEVGDLLGWSEAQVGEIRRRYVDDRAIVVALGRRLAGPAVKRSVKRRA